ncbi:hypothetical protein [Streptomyces palmae]|uniref:Uncharacterized protein n=1 Tax=Streptomyces palmae TaxID=1701085 RepID=A0A4Z0HE75_9ACTN|nr:hypothetical protein [Streptomyces palmae]TGB19597.1 hypothetical protein E4099_00130 [Streptomyces palmae]
MKTSHLSEEPLDLTFHDNLQPGLKGGEYCVTVEQNLCDNGKPVDGGAYFKALRQEFTVVAPRFTLEPALVHAVTPAPGATGDFTDLLPHVTLNLPSLPWLRRIGITGDDDKPWMALLILRDNEIADDPQAQGETTARTAGTLHDPSTEKNVAAPTLTLSTQEKAVACRTIDVTREAFTDVVPRADELRYLSHVRDAEPRLLIEPVHGERLQAGHYGVVLSSRLARQTGSFVAHLVSLEGHGTRLTGSVEDGIERVRLISLWSWTFHNAGRSSTAHFPSLARGLVLKENKKTKQQTRDDLLLRRPVPPPDEHSDTATREVRRRLCHGYVPVAHRLASGEESFAWYRGPLSPVIPQPLPIRSKAPSLTSDHLSAYLPAHGVFDLSYACAWTLGRAAAMADADYIAALVRWRNSCQNLLARTVATARERTGDRAPEIPAPWPQRLLSLCSDGSVENLATRLAEAPAGHEPAPPSQAAPPTRPAELVSGHGAHLIRAVRQAQSEDDQDLLAMNAWLERLRLLGPVPFPYLVPDADMLPPESLRFFHVDQDWIDALESGARSVGAATMTDALADEAALDPDDEPVVPQAGLLLRSALVSGWPDLVIEAQSKTKVPNVYKPVPAIRRDQLAEDVLLCLYADVPDKVVLREPPQGLHFGFDSGDTLTLRNPRGEGCGTLWPDKKLVNVTTYLRCPGRCVFDITCLTAQLKAELEKTAGSLPPFGPADLAVQLFNAPYQFTFHPPGGT